MEHMPPPIPPQAQAPQATCQWCNKPMDSTAINCPNCGRLRKDIYNNKVMSYIFCIPAGLLIGFSFTFNKNHNQNYDFNDFNTANSSGSSTGTILLVIGIVLGLIGTYFYVKASQQMKKWWWV